MDADGNQLPPNEAISHLRRVELEPGRTAPFSDNLILSDEDLVASSSATHPGTHVPSRWDSSLVDIPIKSIVGISSKANLVHERGHDFQVATFGDALFEALHGASLICPQSLDYLCSPDTIKADGVSRKLEQMPQIANITSFDSKYKARGGMTFSRHGDQYIAHAGQQRTIIAMYAIWQRFGDKGMLCNVRL